MQRREDRGEAIPLNLITFALGIGGGQQRDLQGDITNSIRLKTKQQLAIQFKTSESS